MIVTVKGFGRLKADGSEPLMQKLAQAAENLGLSGLHEIFYVMQSYYDSNDTVVKTMDGKQCLIKGFSVFDPAWEDVNCFVRASNTSSYYPVMVNVAAIAVMEPVDCGRQTHIHPTDGNKCTFQVPYKVLLERIKTVCPEKAEALLAPMAATKARNGRISYRTLGDAFFDIRRTSLSDAPRMNAEEVAAWRRETGDPAVRPRKLGGPSKV